MSTSRSKASTVFPAPFLYNATVVSVHDGDSVNVIIDRGMFDYAGSTEHPVPVRLVGMNARELSEPGGPEAAAYLTSLLPAGTKIVLTTLRPDKFAPRWDAYVTTETIPDLAAHLIDNDWAAAWDGNGTRPKPPWPRPERIRK